MASPYEWQVGWRYVRAARSGSGNGFISFISGVSMAGIALGVAALIVVMSVMNGFDKEVRQRMLSVIAHVEVYAADPSAPTDWPGLAERLRGAGGEIQAVAPFVAAQALIGRGDELRPVVLRGVDPAQEASVSALGARLRDGAFAKLAPGAGELVLGTELAHQLKAAAGQSVTLVLPQPDRPGALPRMIARTVAATFQVGHYEYDSSLVLMRLDDARALVGSAGVGGLRLRLADRDRAPQLAQRLAIELGPRFVVRDWTQTNRQWFDQVQLQKQMLFLILALIVAVAAFNLVSTLVMTVTDKRGDIAILRTLGASPGSVMKVFIVQGAVAGVVGTLIGTAVGLAIAYNVGDIVKGIETLLRVTLLQPSIYLIDRMPSDPQRGDIVPIVVISLLLSFATTLYPSWRASRINPAEALRYE